LKPFESFAFFWALSPSVVTLISAHLHPDSRALIIGSLSHLSSRRTRVIPGSNQSDMKIAFGFNRFAVFDC